MLSPDADRRPVVSGRAYGKDWTFNEQSTPLTFIVDTGAGFPVLARSTADQFVWHTKVVYGHALLTGAVSFTDDLDVSFDRNGVPTRTKHLNIAVRSDNLADELLGMSALAQVKACLTWDPDSGKGNLT